MSPGFWLHHAALAWRQLFDRRLRPLNLTPTQFMLLASVGWLAASCGQQPTQQEVADHVGADRMMTSKVLQTLVDRLLALGVHVVGWVTRQQLLAHRMLERPVQQDMRGAHRSPGQPLTK